MNDTIKNMIDCVEKSLHDTSFVKMSLGNYCGNDIDLKNIYIKNVIIKKEEKLSFTYRYKTKDIIKNYSFAQAKQLLVTLMNAQQFRVATLFTTQNDIALEYGKNDVVKLNQRNATHTSVAQNQQHDKQKNRKIEAVGKKYLQELKITNQDGVVYKDAQDKFKQINHYIEILSSLLKDLPNRDIINVVDMGAGKGYLTFALYDYLTNILQKPATVTGVEFRKDLVELCNAIAKKANFNNLSFVQSTIQEYENKNMDVLIALHACDTATDDAIFKGIQANADLIVVAPCCHKQIRREIEKNKAKNDLDFLLKHGIFLERQAEMVTDGIRALILEYYGYSTKVFEFISDAHTPKNVLIVGQKKQQQHIDKEAILTKIKTTKAYFGIGSHYLESLINSK